MIEIKNVTKKYGDYVAVEDISFKVEESSIYGLVGYNGAGKTTLLKTAAGILKPESGEVLFDSQNVYDNGKVRSSLLYVPDEVYFVKGASLEKMGKIYKGYFPNFNSKVFKNMTEAMGLDPKKNIGSFSKGMQRQAEVVLAMSTMPKYMLLDEVFDGIDPLKRNLCKKIFIEYMAETGCSMIMSSHNLQEIADLCDHVALINGKKLAMQARLMLNIALFLIEILINQFLTGLKIRVLLLIINLQQLLCRQALTTERLLAFVLFIWTALLFLLKRYF